MLEKMKNLGKMKQQSPFLVSQQFTQIEKSCKSSQKN